MKMTLKSCTLLFMVFLFLGNLQGQTYEPCVTPDSLSAEMQAIHDEWVVNWNDPARDITEYYYPKTIPIKFYVVREEGDESGETGLSDSDLATAKTNLSNIYSGYDISFDFLEDEYINNNDLYDYHTSDAWNSYYFPFWYDLDYGLLGTHPPGPALKVLFINMLNDGFNDGKAYTSNHTVLVVNTRALANTLSHEIGHVFGLSHTHNDYAQPERVIRPEDPVDESCVPNCEDLGYATGADGLCDTPADPNLWNCGPSGGQACVDLYGNLVFELGQDECGYNYAPDIFNIMSYSQPTIYNSFSDGQSDKMHYTLHNGNLLNLTIHGMNQIAEEGPTLPECIEVFDCFYDDDCVSPWPDWLSTPDYLVICHNDVACQNDPFCIEARFYPNSMFGSVTLAGAETSYGRINVDFDGVYEAKTNLQFYEEDYYEETLGLAPIVGHHDSQVITPFQDVQTISMEVDIIVPDWLNLDGQNNDPNLTYQADLNFLRLYDVNILNSLSDDNMTLEIRDPWYIETEGEFAGMRIDDFHDISQGEYLAFLGEGGYEPDDLQPPYYSIRAPLYYATTTEAYIFSGWSADENALGVIEDDPAVLETPVVFLTEGAVVTANYVPINNIISSAFQVLPDETVTLSSGLSYVLENVQLTVDGELIIPSSSNVIFSSGSDLIINGQVTIEEGAVLEFADESGIEVYGALNVNEGATDPAQVIFTSFEEQWNGIYVSTNGSSGGSIHLNNVLVENSYYGVEVYIRCSEIVIENSEFRNNSKDFYYQVYQENDSPSVLIENSLFKSNVGISITRSETPITIRNCEFDNNNSPVQIFYLEGELITIEDNQFKNIYLDAIKVFALSGSVTCQRNTIEGINNYSLIHIFEYEFAQTVTDLFGISEEEYLNTISTSRSDVEIKILNNTLTNSTGPGVVFDMDFSDCFYYVPQELPDSYNIHIENNIITGNGNYGIYAPYYYTFESPYNGCADMSVNFEYGYNNIYGFTEYTWGETSPGTF